MPLMKLNYILVLGLFVAGLGWLLLHQEQKEPLVSLDVALSDHAQPIAHKPGTEAPKTVPVKGELAVKSSVSLFNQPLGSFNRTELKALLQQDPDQLFEYLETQPDLTPSTTRLLLDVVYQFDDAFRLKVAETLLYGEDPDHRYASYQLLAAADSETDDPDDYYIRLILDASEVEQNSNNLMSVMTLLHDETLTEKVEALAMQRAEQLLEHQSSEVKAEALRFLLKLKPEDSSLHSALAQNIASGDAALMIPAMQALYRVNSPSHEVIEQLVQVMETQSQTGLGQEAAALLYRFEQLRNHLPQQAG